MWQRYILPSAALLALAIFPVMLSASAETFPNIEKGADYTREPVGIAPNGGIIYRWSSSPERIFDGTSYRDYIITQDADTVKLETANAGSLIFNKNSCSYNLYSAGIIGDGAQPKVRDISWTVKGKAAASSTWNAVTAVNSAACVVTVQSTDETVRIIGERAAASGTFQIVLDYSPGRGIKETFRAYNNNPAWTNHNIGFTETFKVPRTIHFGQNTYDLANYNGTILNRNWIENNEAKLVKLSDKIFYDFGIGFDNLNDIKITWDGSQASLALNYLYPTQTVPYQEWFEVDPVFGYTAAQSQQSVITGVTAQCYGAAATTNNTAASTTFRTYVPSTGAADNCIGQLTKFIITSIPDDAIIVSANLLHDRGAAGASANVRTMIVRNVTLDPQGSATPAQKWVQMTQGNFVVSPFTEPAAGTSNYVTPFNSNGTTAIQNALSQNYIGFAMMFVSQTSDASQHILENTNGFELEVTYTFLANPNAVTDLTATPASTTSVTLDWTQPTLNLGSLLSYQINGTTPFGDPLTIFQNDSGTGVSYLVTGLAANTNYSLRVGVQTTTGYNGSGNIANITTAFVPANFTIGDFNFNSENPDITPIRFERTDNNASATTLTVIYDNTFSMNCNFEMEFSRESITYTGISGSAFDGEHDEADFVFLDPADEIINARCWDSNTNTTGRYVITQSSFPFLDQLQNFRSGAYGTDGTFGAFDLITLAVVIISMIGFNRVNETVGGILNISLLAALAYYDIIELPTVIFGAIAVIVVVIVGSTRKD